MLLLKNKDAMSRLWRGFLKKNEWVQVGTAGERKSPTHFVILTQDTESVHFSTVVGGIPGGTQWREITCHK
jgi:hypothetical protein